MQSYTKIKKQILRDKTINKHYQKLDLEFTLARDIIAKRVTKGFTQTTLARKIGTKQSSIARLESGNYNPTLAFLEKVAKALDTQLSVSLL